jgi:hypothetical protein
MIHRLIIIVVLTLLCCACSWSLFREGAGQKPGSENSILFPVHRQTTYFDFHVQRESHQNANTIAFADGFVSILKRDFFAADRGYPIRVFIARDEGQFIQFMHQDLGIPDASDYGIYVPSRQLLATYEGSGLGTFTHETMHPLIEQNLSHRPGWTFEGIPTFFEKFYGYWDNGQLVLYWGFQNPWRIRDLGPQLTHLELKQIVSENGITEPDESKLRLAVIFLWEQGKFKRFLRLIATNNSLGYPTFLEAAMGMPMEKITPIWQSYLQGIERNRTEVLSLPISAVLRNKAEFQDFVKTHNISLKQTKQLD